MFTIRRLLGFSIYFYFYRSLLQMKLEEVTRRAQEQLQIVLEEQSRLEQFNLAFILFTIVRKIRIGPFGSEQSKMLVACNKSLFPCSVLKI